VNPRRLYRSRNDRVITGIAGGMAEYLEVDPTVVRILWVLAAIFTGGLVLLLYVVLAFIIQLNPYQAGPVPAGAWGAGYAAGAGSPAPAGYPAGAGSPAPAGWAQPTAAPGATGPAAPGAAYATGYAAGGAPAWNNGWNAEYERSRAARTERPGRAGLIIGSVLIVFGVIALADVVIPGWLSGALVVPGLFVALGVGLLVASLRGSSEAAPAAATPAPAPFAAPAPEPFAASEPDATAVATTADASPEVVPAAEYDDDATSTLPPQPGSDPA
jgi:phage shock protein PspC (stress-responsive transcriptional regulator)